MPPTPTSSPADLVGLVNQVLRANMDMPVRTMEAILEHGDAAVEPVLAALESIFEPDATGTRNPFWLMVLLGEIRSPRAVPTLVRMVEAAEREDFLLPLIASEALAKIGSRALRGIGPLLESDAVHRVWAYGIASWIADDEAFALLLGALEEDRENIEALALALAQVGRADAIPPLLAALEHVHPRKRDLIEVMIATLHHGEAVKSPHTWDWRIRYRTEPEAGVPTPGWPTMAVGLIGRAPDPDAPILPARSLDEILHHHEDPNSLDPEVCDCCGTPPFETTGVLSCPASAVGDVLLQLAFLDTYKKRAGSKDVFDVLDRIEDEVWVFHREEADKRSRPDDETAEETLARLELSRGVCFWLIEQQIESLEAGRARLLAEAARLAALHGDPDGLLESLPTSARTRPEPGRNDPCPCGSGRKYKKCCGRPGAGRDVLPPPREDAPPELVVPGGEPMVFATARYRVADAASVRAALRELPELVEQDDGTGFDWIEPIDEDMGRGLGHIEVHADRLLLECMSEGRMRRGKELLEGAAGAWLSHLADTLQDPWVAARESAARGSGRRADRRDREPIPPEVEAAAIQKVLAASYRTWPDEALPALGGRTARDAVRTAKGRAEVADLLRSIEEYERGKPKAHRFDFTPIWKELGIEELR